MRIYDPEQCRNVDLADCFQLTEIDGWTPTVANEDVGWFVVDMQTNQSRKPELLEEETLKKVTLAVEAHSLSESLLGRLSVLSEREDLESWMGLNIHQLEEESDSSLLPIRVALAKGQAEGYTLDQIRFCLNTRHELPDDAFQVVEGLDEADITSLAEGVEDKHILKAIFVMGAGASGKSKVGDEMFAGLGMKFINQDKHLTRFFKEADLALSQIGSDYGLFKKAQALGRKELKHYAQQRLGLVIDMTGWDFKRVERPVNRLHALGYDCYAVLVHASLEKSQRRNLSRERKVPDYYVATAHRGLWSNFPRYSRLFGKEQTFLIRNEDDIEQDVWDREIGPKLRAAALRILAKPLKNKNGLKWIAKALQAKGVQPQIEAEVFPTHLPFTEETLDEAFDKPYKFKWVNQKEGVWAHADVPGTKGKTVALDWFVKNHRYSGGIRMKGDDSDSFEVSLNIDGKESLDYGANEVSEPARVAATVFAATKRFIKEVDPDRFWVRGGKSKKRLFKAYAKMVERLGYDAGDISLAFGNVHQSYTKRGKKAVVASDDYRDDLTEDQTELRKGTVAFPKTNATFMVELAETPEQIARGMMFRESLPVDSGMLFLMPERGQHPMFMRNTHLPLDMVFIDEDKIVHIEENTTPYSEEVRTNETPASMVLEVNAGTVRDYKMSVGDSVVVTQWAAQKVHSDDKQTTR